MSRITLKLPPATTKPPNTKTHQTDYNSVYVDKNKPLPKYNTDERRAYEYQILLERGTLRALNTRELGRIFEVAHTTIVRDRKHITDYLMDSLQRHYILPEILAVKMWALKKAREAGDYKSADQMTDGLLKMMFDMGVLQKATQDILVNNQVNMQNVIVRWARPEEVEKKDEG